MILKRLTVCGFRGVKEPLDINIPSGFVVVCGHNGSGKSTLCDAIEFALSGTLVGSGRKENRESIDDYVWWRGSGQPADRFVELVLASGSGTELHIRRTPHGVKITGPGEIEKVLCDAGTAPSNAMERLCLTSIIRDEQITQQSFDLSEPERFEFVRQAIGASDLSLFESRIKKLVAVLEGEYQSALRNYQIEQRSVTDLTARLTSARVETNSSGDVDSAELVLRQALHDSSSAVTVLLSKATRTIGEHRQQIDALVSLLASLQSVRQRLESTETPEHAQRLTQLRERVETVRSELRTIEEAYLEADRNLEAARLQEPYLTALARLHESGVALGLNNGHCPLCGTEVDKNRFVQHVESIRKQLQQEAEAALHLERLRSSYDEARRAARAALARSEHQLAEAMALTQRLQAEDAAISSRVYQVLDVSANAPVDADTLSAEVERLRQVTTNLERALATLEASRGIQQLKKHEAELTVARSSLRKAEQHLQKTERARAKVKDGLSALLRLRGQIVDEALAQLTPLMSELYVRLKPHVDWQEISYRIRGDVKRFLSFEVGEGLNPSFLFSSGQRRAAGMAFLLAVHLARPWCRFKTLVLDDPVQHVDDFRALNLTELLAAIRRSGRQVFCTTEDGALAELMARRLRSTREEPGLIIRMTYDSLRGASIAEQRVIQPMPQHALLPA